jgi:FkbM family methyltransferase
MAITSPRSGGHPALHRSRLFGRPPDLQHALALLAAMADAPCPFGPVSADRPLALYGAGNLGRLARDFLRTVGLDAALVIDRDAERLADDPAWRDLRIVHPADVTASDKRDALLLVSVATSPFAPLEQELADQGFCHVAPFYDLAENFRHLHPLSNGWFAQPFTTRDRENAAKVLARWHDDVSRAHHVQFIAWHRLREECAFDGAPMPQGRRFLIPEVTAVLRRDETLLDGGAHVGSVARAFATQTGGAFRQIVAVEPDPASRARLAIAMAGDARVTVRDCALGARDGEATFHDGLGYASQLADTGRMRVALRTIDGLGLAPTFVKLHLEGHELAALKGARQTLLAQRPIVAATIYHNADGIWRTPLWLMQTLVDYRFLLRLDSWCGTGAVVYAIPNERRAAR